MGGPELELGVAIRAQARQIIVAAREQIDPGECLRVAAIEPFRQPHDRREHPNRAAEAAVEVPVSLVRFFRGRLPMVSRDERDNLDLLRIETPQISILDQVVGMAVVALVTDVNADIVQQGGEFEPLALAISQPMDAARLVENAERQPGDLLRML